MPRHNCSDMQRFFRNVHVVSVRNPNTDNPVPDMWFWTKPAKYSRPKSRNRHSSANWDARFSNGGAGSNTPVQRWIYAQATGAIVHKAKILGQMTPYTWWGDDYKIFQTTMHLQQAAKRSFDKRAEEGTEPIPFMKEELPGFWMFNPMYKVVSPWNLTQLNKNGHPERITKVKPRPVAIYKPQITDIPRRLAMLVAYSKGHTDREVDEMIYEGLI